MKYVEYHQGVVPIGLVVRIVICLFLMTERIGNESVVLNVETMK